MDNLWNRTLRIAAIASATLLPFANALPARADVPGEHPHYLHALSDLRYARALIERADERNVMRLQNDAYVEINQAIGEVRRAAYDDRKDLDDHPPIDANLSHRDRLRKTLALLRSADRDLHYEEDTRAALGWRARSIGDVNDAIGFVSRAISTDRWDDHHQDMH